MAGSVGIRITEDDLGSGWRTLHEHARRRRRHKVSDQIVAWLQYAAAQAQDGVDVELSQARLDALLALEAA